jgi:deazaflavin-dependent oxidoreductase (nitroreductase family)
LPAPRSIARFNKRFTNKLTSEVAGYLPGFAIVSHIGRKSGRTYRTPVNAFRTDDGYIIALTYGSESDWVKNVLAAGSCELQTRGQIDAPQYMRLSLERASTGSPHPILADTLADEIIRKLDYNCGKFRLSASPIINIALRAKKLDELALKFVTRHPDACALDLLDNIGYYNQG